MTRVCALILALLGLIAPAAHADGGDGAARSNDSLRGTYTLDERVNTYSVTFHNPEDTACIDVAVSATLDGTVHSKNRLCSFVEGKQVRSLKRIRSAGFYEFEWNGSTPTFVLQYTPAGRADGTLFYSCGVQFYSFKPALECYRLSIDPENWDKRGGTAVGS